MRSLTKPGCAKKPLPPPEALPVVDRADVVVGECHGISEGETTRVLLQPPASLHPHSLLAPRAAPGTSCQSRGYKPLLPARGEHSSCGTSQLYKAGKRKVHEPSTCSAELPVLGPGSPALYPHPCREPPPAPVQCSCLCGPSSPSCCCAPRAPGDCSVTEPPSPAWGSPPARSCAGCHPMALALPCFPQPPAGQQWS